MFHLKVEALDERTLPSVVAPVLPTVDQATVSYTPPISSNKGNFDGGGWWEGKFGMSASSQRPAQPSGIIAILIGL